MEHFNHAKLPAWTTITDSERYWAGLLARQAEDQGLVREWYYGSATFLEYYSDDGAKQTLAYAYDSVLTAIVHQETKIAFRALLQAAGYISILRDMGLAGSTLPDAYRVALARVEKLLSG